MRIAQIRSRGMPAPWSPPFNAESDPGICVELAEAAAGMLPETDDAGKMAEESAPLEP